jgi:hypothetical protein
LGTSNDMNYQDNSYVTTQDLLFLGVLHDIKKSKTALQPVYEAFTNAIEAIKIKAGNNKKFKGRIEIKIFATETTVADVAEFKSLSISDNGVGFNEKEFRRFNTFKDFTKGFKNLGSGRIQFAHYFNSTVAKSVFEQDGKYFEREFVVSKDQKYTNHNAIVFHKHCTPTSKNESGTSISFNGLLENSNIYDSLTHDSFKEFLIERYIHYFCYNRDSLPKITIEYYVQGKLKGKSAIQDSDIPKIDKSKGLKIQYSKLSPDGKSIQKIEKTSNFRMDSFKIDQHVLKANKLQLVSKGEIVEESNVTLQGLAETDHIKGSKFLFLLSGDYIDSKDTNMRGELTIPDRDSFSRNTNLFTQEEILIEEIQDNVNTAINGMYPEIEEVTKAHQEQFDELKKMFLLNDETAKEIHRSVNDSETKILEKFYEAEAKKAATIDASIKVSIDKLNHLNTVSATYNEDLVKEVENLVKIIPHQNKLSLTQYVARRKLVLDLFDRILTRQLEVQKNGRNIDEQLLHNLIFQQSTTNPEQSDLWLVNEDFIYFKGTSESKLQDIKINGKTMLRDNLNEEENKFRLSLGEDRYTKRPDILLFPDEGKCIIVEFKNPSVNISDHLNQINNYATLIRNFALPEFKFNTFYGYLIGEQINPMDVRAHDADFKEAYNFDYLFRSNKVIPAFFSAEKTDGSLYTEVITYSTLLGRAKRRNEIFIKKLTSSRN